MAITVQHLSKVFQTKKKKEGVWNSIKSLVSPQYEDVHAVQDVSFNIEPGDVVGFIGPNGAGKSTTIKMLTGILWPTEGDIDVLGYDPQREREQLANHIGTVFGQRQQLWLHLPPLDSYELFKHVYGVPEQAFNDRLERLIDLFEIRGFVDQPVRKLSLGQRMRCEFVASLLHNPELLFLDEPTIGIDSVTKKKIRRHIKRLNEEHNTTIILTSHDFDDIEALCDRVIIINDGEILYDDTTKALKQRITKKTVKITFTEATKATSLPFNAEQDNPYEAHTTVDTEETSVADILRALPETGVEDISVTEPDIDSIIETYFE